MMGKYVKYIHARLCILSITITTLCQGRQRWDQRYGLRAPVVQARLPDDDPGEGQGGAAHGSHSKDGLVCHHLGRLTMMASSTASICVTSCALAPVTTSDNGTPRPSTRRWRLLPFFSPIRRIGSDGLLSQRRLEHRPVKALPAPGDALQVVVLGQAPPATAPRRSRPETTA